MSCQTVRAVACWPHSSSQRLSRRIAVSCCAMLRPQRLRALRAGPARRARRRWGRSMAQQDTAIRLLKRWDELWGQQATARTVWQDIADYVIPYKSNILVQRAEGEKQTAKLYDATAPHSAILLAASIHASMTPATQPWLSLKRRQAEVNGLKAA